MCIVPFRQVSPSGSCRGSAHSPNLLSSLDCQRCPFQQKDELPEKEEKVKELNGGKKTDKA